MIWRKLTAEGSKIVTSSDVRVAAQGLGKDYVRSLRYLQEHNYLSRIFRGIFYVNSPTERESGIPEVSIFKIVAEALAMKSVKRWYIGLETALRINGLTHEYFTINYVVTDSYRTTKVIRIMDSKFQFLKWSPRHFETGITREFDIKFSDKEKTILDLVFKRYIETRDERIAISAYLEYERVLDKEMVRRYMAGYPLIVQRMVGDRL